jgi:hypothetical protein
MKSNDAIPADLELQVLEFQRKDLDALSKDERALFLLFGHIANELAVLNKLHLWSSYSVPQDGILGHAGITQALVIARLLASKLLEAWHAIQRGYFGTKLSQEYEKLLSEEGRRALKACGQYFGKTNGLFQTRNNFGFHYSVDEVEVGLDRASPDERLTFYLAEARGNNLYYASEVTVGTAHGTMVGSGDVGVGIRTFLEDIATVSGEVQTFLDQFIATVLFRYFGDPETVLRSESVSPAPSLHSVRIPYFISIPEAEDGA